MHWYHVHVAWRVYPERASFRQHQRVDITRLVKTCGMHRVLPVSRQVTSTSRRQGVRVIRRVGVILNSFFWLPCSNNIFTFYSSVLPQRHLLQQKRRPRRGKASLREFSGLPPVRLQLFMLAAPSHHFIVRRTMTSSLTAYHWVNPCLTMENLTDGIH